MTLNLNRANLSLDPLNAAINARIEQASLAKHANDHAARLSRRLADRRRLPSQNSIRMDDRLDVSGAGALDLCARALLRDREQAAAASTPASCSRRPRRWALSRPTG